LQGKLRGLDLSSKQELVETKPKTMSLSRQTELLGISRSAFYYKLVVNEKKVAIKKQIEKIFEETPIYGEKKVHKQLIEDGFQVSLNTVSKYPKELGLRAVLAVKPISTTMSDVKHPKYRQEKTI